MHTKYLRRHLLFVFAFTKKLFFFLPFAVLGSSAAWSVNVLTTAATFAPTSDDRRVGIEVEFSGLSIEQTLAEIQAVTAGKVVRQEKLIKTTLKEISADGLVFNEAKIPEWVIDSPSMGKIIIKIDNNQINDEEMVVSKDDVIEIVTSPIRGRQVEQLQAIMDRLVAKGARGTKEGEPVSIQYNTEVNSGHIMDLNWLWLVDVMKVYLSPNHRVQIDAYLQVPPFRKPYVGPYSPGFTKRLFSKGYRPAGRQLYDDFIYRQSLEYLGFGNAWTTDIQRARELLLAQKNPIVPAVVKQNLLRISSVLIAAFPNDPMSQLFVSSGWAQPHPIIEWREFNNDFKVLTHYKEVLGLMEMVTQFGAFDHDRLMSQLSGIEPLMIERLRKRFETLQRESSPVPLTFRYYLGDPEIVRQSSYETLTKVYRPHSVGFLPFYEYGEKPLILPGESVVMHRNQFHRFNVLGKYNLTLLNGFIMQALENKYVEMRFWNDYAKQGIPRSSLVSELGIAPISTSSGSSDTELKAVEKIVDRFDEWFPKGWVLKGLFDLGTEKDILSDKTNLRQAVKTYLGGDFNTYEKELREAYADLNIAPEYLLTELKKHPGYKGWKFLNMLQDPAAVMIQERYNILREFRVEVVAGRVLGGDSTLDRYGYLAMKNGQLDSSYQQPTKEEIAKVEDFARELATSLPPKFQNMTFGLDVALVEGGGCILIESNPGGNSNFLYEEEPESIRQLNKFLEQIPTLMKSGEVSPGLSPQEQMAYLQEKFREWNVDVQHLYPGMSFLKDRIEDREFKKREPRKVTTSISESVSRGFSTCQAALKK